MYPPHDLGGGYEITWRASVEHLEQAGHEVRVLTSDYRAPGVEGNGEGDVHRELRSYWEDHAFPRLGPRERLRRERFNANVLERHLGEFSPDVVNWWGMGGMSLGLIERVRLRGLPAVGVVGDEWMVWGPRADAWQRPFRRWRPLGRAVERMTGCPTRTNLGASAHWLFNSDHVRRRSGASSYPHAGVAHPGIDDGLFRAAEEQPWGWRLLYLGRLDPRKGVDTAVAALALLPPQATLVLQGSGDSAYTSELREQAERLGVADRVRFSALPRAALPDVYAASDAVLFPVRWEEPWGLVPLEAMAVARPVVATGTGGSSEYLRHERNALIYEPRDSAEALAAAVTRLAREPELRARLRAEGLATAARYTERAYNEAIAAAIEAVANA
jgi:glycosyltransferase involved in cell wall biosynthesis